MRQFNEHTSVLPPDFDGDFYFANPDTEVFEGKWGGKSYNFAPNTRSKMIIRGAAPEEVQNIRKKFARELAEKMFFKSQKAAQMAGIEKMANGEPVLRSIHQANVYSDADLKPFIQACLDPLPTARLTVSDIPKDPIEDRLSKDEDGELVSRAVKPREALKEKVFADDPQIVG